MMLGAPLVDLFNYCMNIDSIYWGCDPNPEDPGEKTNKDYHDCA